MHFWSWSSFSLTYNVANSSLKDLHCILPSKGFSWSTGFHTPEIAKLFGDTCSANLHPLCNLPEHTVQWHFSIYLLACWNGSCLPLIFLLWGRAFSHLLFLCVIHLGLEYGIPTVGNYSAGVNSTLPPVCLQHSQVEKRWKESENHVLWMYLVPFVAASYCLGLRQRL